MRTLQPVEGNVVSRYDAAKFNQVVISNWKDQLEVWPFSVGDTALGFLSSLSAFHLTLYLRKALSIRPYGRITCFSPVMGMAGIATFLFHSEYVTARVLERGDCSICLGLRSATGQVVCGSLYPLLTAPVVCFYMADRLLSYPVPPLTRAPLELLKVYAKLLAKNPRPFLVYGMLNAMAGFALSQQKEKTYAMLLEKM